MTGFSDRDLRPPDEHQRARPVVLVFIGRVVLGGALLVGLYNDARLQPNSTRRFSWASSIAHGGYATSSTRQPERLVVRVDASGFRVVAAVHDSAAQTSLPTHAEGWIDYAAHFYGYERRHGLWALTDRVRTCRLTIYPLAGSDGVNEPPGVRAAATGWLLANGWIDSADRDQLVAGDFVRHTSIPSGWVHTTVVFVLFVLALAIVPFRQMARLAVSLVARRQPPDPWICEKCGYDLRGIDIRCCPECGEPRHVIPPLDGGPQT